jgi:hypothetical protein
MKENLLPTNAKRNIDSIDRRKEQVTKLPAQS